MTANYYYLVAGLPDLLLDEGKQQVSCLVFINEAAEQLKELDFNLFNLLRLPFDNKNLLSLILKSDHPYDNRGSIGEVDLAEGVKNPDMLPGYMELFVEAYRENRPPVQGLTPEDQLAWFFYEELTGHNEPFIREWYTFDLNLRNILAGLNCRKDLEHIDELATDRDKAFNAVIIGRDEVAESILRSNAQDFGLSAQLPWVEHVVSLSRGSIQEFEKGIDTLRWDILNEMTILSHFRAETVFAFFIKLIIVERWQALDPETGREQLERLLDELTASYEIPAAF